MDTHIPQTRLSKAGHEIPALVRLRQENYYEFKASLSYRISSRIAGLQSKKIKLYRYVKRLNQAKGI